MKVILQIHYYPPYVTEKVNEFQVKPDQLRKLRKWLERLKFDSGKLYIPEKEG